MIFKSKLYLKMASLFTNNLGKQKFFCSVFTKRILSVLKVCSGGNFCSFTNKDVKLCLYTEICSVNAYISFMDKSTIFVIFLFLPINNSTTMFIYNADSTETVWLFVLLV